MTLEAILFDMDGTLVDTNPMHAESFAQAFKARGYGIPADRIAPEVGKGGDQLVPDLIGVSGDEKDGEALRKDQAKRFIQTITQSPVDIVPGACELLGELKKRGLRLALATSAKPEMLEAIEKSCGVAWRDEFEVVTTAADAENSKPAPDILNVALEKLGLSPAQCAFVGDTPHDARACRAAGVACLGVLSGGHAEADLREAGCRAVYENCAALLADLDNALQLASPIKFSLSRAELERIMRAALDAAREGMARGEVPIGAAIADGSGKILATASNQMNATQRKTAHAEMMAFEAGDGKIDPQAKDLIVAATLEPCVMCGGALMLSGVDTVIFGLEAPFDGATHRVSAPRSPESLFPRFVGGVLADESRALLQEWLDANRETEQADYVKQLLESG